MPRRKNIYIAEHAARARGALKARFGDLDRAIRAWRDGGSFSEVEVALDALQMEPAFFEPITLSPKPSYEELVQARAVEYVIASQFSHRLEAAASASLNLREAAKDELFAAVVNRPAIPEYAETFLRRLQAEGIGQTDLHPPSKALAREVAAAIRAYNAKRRAHGSTGDDVESDEPIQSWNKLPRRFAGFELREIDAPQLLEETYPLPPQTDIARFTLDGQPPLPGRSRRETYRQWSAVIMKWAENRDELIDATQAGIWAMLLAHRFNDDDSDVGGFYNRVIDSPWTEGKFARIERAAKT